MALSLRLWLQNLGLEQYAAMPYLYSSGDQRCVFVEAHMDDFHGTCRQSVMEGVLAYLSVQDDLRKKSKKESSGDEDPDAPEAPEVERRRSRLLSPRGSSPSHHRAP